MRVKYQLLVRQWYHERGFGTPYVVKTTDTDEVCLVRWVVTSQDIEKAGLGDRFPKLEADEVMIENVYTLERFRKGCPDFCSYTKCPAGYGIQTVQGLYS